MSEKSPLQINIQRQRKLLGWSQDDLASAMRQRGFRWSRMTVTRVEGVGRSRRVLAEELIGLARAMLVSPEALVLGDPC